MSLILTSILLDDEAKDICDMTHIGLPTAVYWKNLEFYNLKRLTGKDRIIAQDKDHIDGDLQELLFSSHSCCAC